LREVMRSHFEHLSTPDASHYKLYLALLQALARPGYPAETLNQPGRKRFCALGKLQP
jgi:hypothetical protein